MVASPPVDRTVRVLNLLAALPTHEFTLREISDQLGIASATAHSIVLELVAHGYLVRNAARTYSLGTALIPLGNAAKERHGELALVRHELEKISEKFQVDCYATAIVDGSIVILEHVAVLRMIGFSTPRGFRTPLVPPIGTTHFAWESDATIDRWLAEFTGDWTPQQVADYRTLLGEVRDLGYLAGYAKWHRVAEELPQGNPSLNPMSSPEVEYIPVHKAPGSTPRLNHLAVPVLPPRGGRPELVLMLIGVEDELESIGVEPLVTELQGAASRIAAASEHAVSGRP